MKLMNDENWPVPCISGQATRVIGLMWSGRGVAVDQFLDRGRRASRPSATLPPAPSTWNRSSWRHITPFGMPVVPPV
jgi:hypothetical protein